MKTRKQLIYKNMDKLNIFMEILNDTIASSEKYSGINVSVDGKFTGKQTLTIDNHTMEEEELDIFLKNVRAQSILEQTVHAIVVENGLQAESIVTSATPIYLHMEKIYKKLGIKKNTKYHMQEKLTAWPKTGKKTFLKTLTD